ncbi:MAG TPA: CDP-alcohol phosphatidyltransferase family protein, partial [Vicinamibacterales bacterium]|nr:CDP-alcohol phosphatidyltransferase family protein [Vicinamibacterales bacterium]
AYEIEELADVYFFRPLGMVCAKAARAIGLTPTQVTIIGCLVGILGGTMLYSESLALAGFAAIILHGILDSSDGQLARMTGQVTELGRVLDGVGGYLTHTAAYLAIALSMIHHGAAAGTTIALMLATGVCSAFHAQLYDYNRTCYSRAVIARVAAPPANTGIVPWYEAMQRALAGMHPRVEAAIAARAHDGRVGDEDRDRYRVCFYGPVRGWNALGDNTRFYAFGVFAWLHRLDAYFLFILGPMNAVFVALWLWQLRADRRFLAGAVIG